jgi:hypothetical protein
MLHLLEPFYNFFDNENLTWFRRFDFSIIPPGNILFLTLDIISAFR